MTQPTQEPTDQRAVKGVEWRVRQLARRPGSRSASGLAIFEIKVFEDVNVVVAGDGKFKFDIPEDLDEAVLIKAEAWVTGASGSGPVEVQIRNNTAGADMLSTKLSIDVGELNTKDGGTPHVVDLGADDVAWGDEISIDVDAAGDGALGLGVALYFAPIDTANIAITGAQGAPGGATQFQGPYPGGGAAAGTPGGAGSAWQTATGYTTGHVVESGGTFYVATANHTSGATTEPGVGVNWMTVWEPLTYQAGDIVTNNGVVYIVTVDHTATTDTEPGVGVDWEDVFAPFFDLPQESAVEVVMNGNNQPLDIGVKAYVEMPFDGTIVAATLLADIAGDLIVDIWKDTYGAFPPTNADSITSASPPTISGSNKSQDTTLTGWTTTLAAGDILAFNVDSCVAVTKATVSLKIARL